MPVTRISLIAVPDPAKQDEAVSLFSDFINTCKKDGKPYLVASKASKCEVLIDKPGSQKWTVATEVTFANQADADYYQNEDPVYLAMLGRGGGESEGFIAVKADF
ncbi:hypothetical protein F5Y15DRAFT_415600 [Xylariaceae sp. FL0016]|nr:hypothetical protein F5Y15DRAFT_415600 [Xylariaceae sp. FL0016]